MTGNGKTVIIADDHETLVLYLSVLLHRMGFSIIPAKSGEEVLRILEKVTPDLIVADRKMPKPDGVSLLKIIKSDPALTNIPVIIVTAYADQDVFDECMRMGAAGFLTKPINNSSLIKLLQENVSFPNNEKRKNLRCKISEKALVDCAGQQMELNATSLSEGGMVLCIKKPLPIGSRLKVKMEMRPGHFLKTTGEVIYQQNFFNHNNKVSSGMAVKFDALEGLDAVILKDYIMSQLVADMHKEEGSFLTAEGAPKNLRPEL